MKYLILLILLAGCSSAKELMDKAEKKDATIVAEYARQKYPCKDLLKPDTAVIWKDTTVYIDCPDTIKGNDFEVIVTKTDTVNKTTVRTVRVPVNMPVRTQVITKWYEDSAKQKICAVQIANLGVQITNLQRDTASLTASRDNWKGKAKHRERENWIWRIIATVLICWQLWKIYRRLTTIKFK